MDRLEWLQNELIEQKNMYAKIFKELCDAQFSIESLGQQRDDIVYDAIIY